MGITISGQICEAVKPTVTPSDEPLKRQEMAVILKVLEECEGNKTLAAEKLGISRPTLYRKLHGKV